MSISGTVFDDDDDDKRQDDDEPGVPSVIVLVTWESPAGPVIFRTETDENGDWEIDNLPPGSYTVDIDPATLPEGSSVSIDLPLALELPAGADSEVDIPLTDTDPTGLLPTTGTPDADSDSDAEQGASDDGIIVG